MSQSRQLAAIMFTDIVGYTVLMGEDEEKAFELLRKNRELQQPLIEKHGGKLLKEIGDGMLASFGSASDAVYCALDIQKGSQKHTNLSLRIGIHLGDVVFEKGDVFGDGVNIASRIQELASPDGVLVSEPVYQNVSNKKGITTEYIGGKNLKGLKVPVKIYKVYSERFEITTPRDPLNITTEGKIKGRKTAWWLAATLLITAFGYLIFSKNYKGESETKSEVLKNSIAVLPFVDMSSEQDQEYLGDGIAEELINTFARAEDLKVIARTSSFQFKGDNIDIRDIGSKLNVDYVVEGSVRKFKNQLRITVQLINAEDGSHVWSKDFDRQFDEIFTVQSQIAQSVFRELTSSLDLTPLESSTGTTNTEAYEYYMKGVHKNRKLHFSISAEKFIEDFKGVKLLFQEAIQLDSTFADAYAGLSDLYDTGYKYLDDSVYKYKAEINADIALKINPESCYGNIAKGLTFYRKNNPGEAIYHLLNAIAFCPGNSRAYYSLSYILHGLGLHKESLSVMEKGLQMDPINTDRRYWYGFFKTHVGQYNDAKLAFNEVFYLEGRGVDGLFRLACLTRDLNKAEEYLADSSGFYATSDYLSPLLLASRGDTTAIQAAEKVNMPTTPYIRLLLTRANGRWTGGDDWIETDYFKSIEQIQSIPSKCCGSEIELINDTEIEVDEEFTDLIQPLLKNPHYNKLILNSFIKCREDNRKKLKKELELVDNLLRN